MGNEVLYHQNNGLLGKLVANIDRSSLYGGNGAAGGSG